MEMQVHEAESAADAVRLALAAKQQGIYDWFRGQVQDWEVRSTLGRLSEEDRSAAVEKAKHFYGWVASTPGLEELSGHSDAIIAVGQHYGLATNFIDFTTDPRVAGMFASQASSSGSQERPACIVCLNTRDFLEFWKT
jgi:FRG domain-containing protein